MLRGIRFLLPAMAGLILAAACMVQADEPIVLPLWPGTPPGDESLKLPPEADTTKENDKRIAGRTVVRLTNVSRPTIAVYRPRPEKDTGTAIVICPGGGHRVLAYDLEGTEVAAWLNEIGVTGIVLKYRVPARDESRRWSAAVQDAQRAVRLVRHRADDWGLDPQRIGILGFSAGGETAGLTSLKHQESQYEVVDEIDREPARPAFAMLIYPGGFVDQKTARLRDHVSVPADAPAFFFTHAWDDHVSVQNSLLLGQALKEARVSAEMHLFAAGGHGFGLRPTSQDVTQWPVRAAAWLREQGFLTRTADAGDPTNAVRRNPADDLPSSIVPITDFGERADFSHDGRRVLFLSKQFGDVMEYDVATRRIHCRSQHFKHHGFNRAVYLYNGDVLLTGPERSFDATDKGARVAARCQTVSWVLDKSFTKPPHPLGVVMLEGPAVSRTRPRIAWTHDADLVGEHGRRSRISIGDLVYEQGVPALKNVRLLLSTGDFGEGKRPKMIETQNFVPPHDSQLTVTAYQVEGTADTEGYLLDLATGQLTNFTRTPDHYEEVEGLFPDGRSTMVERNEHRGKPWPLADGWRVWFDGSRPPERLTHFLDYPGYKATNYVVSDDGRRMAFQLGKSGDEAGVGYGLFLMDLPEQQP